jgi:hypothetical protein
MTVNLITHLSQTIQYGVDYCNVMCVLHMTNSYTAETIQNERRGKRRKEDSMTQYIKEKKEEDDDDDIKCTEDMIYKYITQHNIRNIQYSQ